MPALAPLPLGPQALSLREMTENWKSMMMTLLPPQPRQSPWWPPLHSSQMLRRDGSHNDYCAIDYRALLSDRASAPQLDFAKSEQAFRDSGRTADVKLQRKYDFDGFIAHILPLRVLLKRMKLSWMPAFLKHRPGNLKVRIHGWARGSTIEDGITMSTCCSLI